MLNVFDGLKSFLRIRHLSTESHIFRLHCQWTVLILLTCSLLLTCRQYFGDPIHCIQRDVARMRALETFCWIHGTFILPDAWNATVGTNVPHPGIDRHVPGRPKVYHAYYQWVSLMLLLQGILFYLPKYVWKCYENGTMKALTLDLDDPLLTEEKAKKNVLLLVNSLQLHWSHHGAYFRSYIVCEFLNLVNVAGQMLLLDAFLNGVFTTFGINVLQWSEWEQEYRTDPLVEAFPRITKCQFHDFGSSGDVQRFDALCLLPFNILNEKIYIFLWFWMMLLCGITSLVVIFLVIMAAMPIFRYCALVLRASRVDQGDLDKLLAKANVGDWFILYCLAKNIHPTHYRSIIKRLATAVDQNGYVSVASSSRMNDGKLDYV